MFANVDSCQLIFDLRNAVCRTCLTSILQAWLSKLDRYRLRRGALVRVHSAERARQAGSNQSTKAHLSQLWSAMAISVGRASGRSASRVLGGDTARTPRAALRVPNYIDRKSRLYSPPQTAPSQI